jgi:hypothetical protein
LLAVLPIAGRTDGASLTCLEASASGHGVTRLSTVVDRGLPAKPTTSFEMLRRLHDATATGVCHGRNDAATAGPVRLHAAQTPSHLRAINTPACGERKMNAV